MASFAARTDPGSMIYEIPFRLYSSSKAALNMLMVGYHKDLKEQGIRVFGVSLGFLATDFAGPADVMRQMGAIEASRGAEVVVDVVVGKRDGSVGQIVSDEGVLPW